MDVKVAEVKYLESPLKMKYFFLFWRPKPLVQHINSISREGGAQGSENDDTYLLPASQVKIITFEFNCMV